MIRSRSGLRGLLFTLFVIVFVFAACSRLNDPAPTPNNPPGTEEPTPGDETPGDGDEDPGDGEEPGDGEPGDGEGDGEGSEDPGDGEPGGGEPGDGDPGGGDPPAPNLPPVVSAGPNQELWWPENSLTLNAVLEDDGMTDPVIRWTLVESTQPGGAGVTLMDDESIAPTVTFDEPGTYRFEIEVNDGDHADSDHLDVTVHPGSPAGRLSSVKWGLSTKDDILPRAEAQGGGALGRLFLFGGFGEGWDLYNAALEVVSYDPAADLYHWEAALPAPFTHAGMAVDGFDIYLAGGRLQGDKCPPPGAGRSEECEEGTTEVYKYDTLQQEWSVVAHSSVARSSPGVVRNGRTLHIFGGIDEFGENEIEEHWALDLDDYSWKELASMPEPRNHIGFVLHDGFIYAIGGQEGSQLDLDAKSFVHRYDPVGDYWEERAPIPVTDEYDDDGVSHISSATLSIGDYIYVFGGEQGHDERLSRVSIYDPLTDSWEISEGLLPQMETQKAFRAAVVAWNGETLAFRASDFDPVEGVWIGTPAFE